MPTFVPLSLENLDVAQQQRAARLNCQGSLFWFIRVGLRRRRLTGTLHLPLCLYLERDHIKDVLEFPRDHFKSTCAGEGLVMWRALPLSNQDIDDFLRLGYGDEFIRFLLRVHNPDSRNILISENMTNAVKLGRKIRWHYESNSIYRTLFSETLPDAGCTWTDTSLHVKRQSSTTGGAHGEGTFDFLGVGSAIQSRHYNGLLIEDDTVGRKAIESQSIMDKTIDYHRLLVGVFENEDSLHENDELNIGNRWSYNDKNSYMREHEPWFRFDSHSALGGCCPLHPPDVPIFPEEFSKEKLLKLKARLGAYNFSCQYLNNPAAPEDADFKLEWLNYFRVERPDHGPWSVIHEVKDGNVKKDLKQHRFSLAMTVDPNHSGNAAAGRCRHAIMILGMSDDGNYYLLESWAHAASYDTFYNMIFTLAKKWGITRIGVESIAAQRYIIHHIQSMNRTSGWTIRVDELKGEVEAPDGTLSRKKEWRIRNVLAPIFEQGKFWVQRGQMDFQNEYQTFPKGKFVDQLDALAYAPQTLRQPLDYQTHMAMLAANAEQASRVGRPYSAGVN